MTAGPPLLQVQALLDGWLLLAVVSLVALASAGAALWTWRRNRALTAHAATLEATRADLEERLTNLVEAAEARAEGHEQAVETVTREQAKAWASVLETLPDLVLQLDRQGTITFVNRPLGESPRDQAVGRPAREHLPEEVADRLGTALERVFTSGESASFEVEVLEGDEAVTHQVRLAPLRLGDRVASAVLVDREVREGTQAEDAWQRSEEFLHAILDSLTSAIAILDPEGRVVAANRSWRQGFHGHLDPEGDHDVGDAYLQALERAGRESGTHHGRIARGIQRVLDGREDLFTLDFAEGEDGPRVWIQVRVSPFQGTSEQGVVVTYEDITERKAVERERQRASEQFEVAVGDLSRSVGAAGDPEQVAARLVDAVLRVTRVAAAGAVGSQGFVALRGRTEEDRETAREALHRDPGELTWVPASLPDAEQPMHLVVLTGAQALPEFEEKKIEILAAQAALALQRAEVLDRVRSAYERLDRSLRQKQVFMDVLSHDLKNPLAVAQGRLELLAMKHPEVQSDLDAIEKSLERAESLIEKAVLYSRLEDQEEIEKGDRDIVQMVWEVVDALQPLADQRGIRVDTALPDLLVFPTHPMLARAVENLVSNAIKWSPEDGTVEVHLAEEGDQARLLVVDHGPGIPEEERRKLFSRFARVDRSGVKGTGLGLAIAKRIVEMHAGEIWVEETPGGGATFGIELGRASGQPVEPSLGRAGQDPGDPGTDFAELGRDLSDGGGLGEVGG